MSNHLKGYSVNNLLIINFSFYTASPQQEFVRSTSVLHALRRGWQCSWCFTPEQQCNGYTLGCFLLKIIVNVSNFPTTEVYLGFCETSIMKVFAKIIDGQNQLTFLAKKGLS